MINPLNYTDAFILLQGIKQARAIFGKARKSKYLVWQVVEASGQSRSPLRCDPLSHTHVCPIAKIELHWNNDPKIATNVFELGLKLFSIDPEYVLQYLDFLIQTNNPNSVFLASSHKGITRQN